MPLYYRSGIMSALKDKGYSSTRLRREKMFGEKTMQDIRTQAEIPYKTISKLCELLNCQPGDLIEYRETEHDLVRAISESPERDRP